MGHPDSGDFAPGSPGAYALRYAVMGWRVFPVHGIRDGACTCGNAHCERPGKHPVRELVRDGLKSATTNPALISAWWTNAPWANVAVRTGPDSGIWALDVDAGGKAGQDSLDALEHDHGALPETAEAMTGGGGRHLIWRYPDGRRIASGTDRLGPGLDIRGEGGYIVVEPSMHVSGTSYVWEGSSDPLEGVEPADAPEWLLALIEERQDQAAAAIAAGAGAQLDQRQVLELRAAMGYLDADDYETWVQVGMALQASGAGHQAFALWNEWSQLSDKYEPKGMRAKWSSFRDRPGGLELASIFAMAQARGWVNPANREAQAFEAKYGKTWDEVNRIQPAPEVYDVPADQVLPFPVPGLDEVCRWIDSMAPVSFPVVTQHAALSLASIAASRLYRTPQGDPLSIYLGAASRSVGELRYAHQAIYTALTAAGLRRMTRTTRWTSPQTIYRSLMRSPACVYLSDDYGGLSAFAKRQPSGLQEQALGVLAAVHDGHPIQIDSPEDAGIKASSVGDGQPVIEAPALSMFALVGWDHMATLLRASEIGRGALEQVLLALGDEDTAQTRDPAPTEIPAWVPAHLQSIRRVSAAGVQLDLESIFQGNAEMPPQNVRTVEFSVAPSSGYSALDAVSNDRRVRPLLTASRGTLRRIAAALAVWRDPASPVVTAEILQWATEYVRARMAALVEQFDILHGDDGRPSAYDAVLAKVLEAKAAGLAKRDLISGCKPYRNLDAEKRGKLLTQMLDDEMIFEIETKPKRGPAAKRYVAAKFVHQGGAN